MERIQFACIIKKKKFLIKIQYGNSIHIRNAEKCYRSFGRCALLYVLALRTSYDFVQRKIILSTESMEFSLSAILKRIKNSLRPEAKWPLLFCPIAHLYKRESG